MPELQDILPDDILVALFAHFSNDEEFEADREKIHRSFFSAKEKFPEVLGQFAFDKDRIFPTCAAIDQALDNLEMSAHLGKMNPDLEKYTIKPSLKKYFDETVKERLSIDSAKIEEASTMIRGELSGEWEQ